MKHPLIALGLLCAVACLGQQSHGIPSSDDRFKVDALVVIAHPDDETVIGPYLAHAIFDEHKRVAVVYGTRGNGGGDATGQQQAASLGAIRQVEATRALEYFGITDIWFLDGPDTPGQDVLRSLETWDHGRSLDRVVRIIRLTRPSVVLTWLPDYVAGENHGDHQAAGVLATEAFDIAGDPSQFPEQVTPPRNARDIGNLTEGLHPWQAQKLYYFSDTSHPDFLAGKGPQYSASDISPSKHASYAHLAAEECAFHLTQSDSGYAARLALDNHTVDKTYLADPSRFVFGKSYVSTDIKADIFDGVNTRILPFKAPPGFQDEAQPTSASVTLGGPWHYYKQFWAAHAIQRISELVPPEILVGESTYVTVPVLVNNPTDAPLSGHLKVELPSGWTLKAQPETFQAEPGGTFAGTIVAIAPSQVSKEWHDIRISGAAKGQTLGELKVRVQVQETNLPQ